MKFSVDNYMREHAKIYEKMDKENIDICIKKVVDKINENKKIITCGNGGSASTSSHYITDWNKMFHLASGSKLRGFCLTDNIGLVTAYGNDISYDEIFAGQLNSIMDEGDLLVAVSGSGNSPNILSAIEKAHQMGGEVLGVLGYDGGKAKDMCDLAFHVPSWDMQVCEDMHLSFGHLVMKEICNNEIRPAV